MFYKIKRLRENNRNIKKVLERPLSKFSCFGNKINTL